ncbi:MAG: acyl-CoA thioesterase [Chroococcales cyanobacterium]
MVSKQQHQLPPTTAIQEDSALRAKTERWYEYPIKAYPHSTDYAGVVWHGTYLQWMEEARVEYLDSIGISYAELVALGCDLPVVDLSIRYHRPIRMGMTAIVKTRMKEFSGVKILWDYQIQSPTREEVYVTAQVTLVAVDREKGKIMRQIPPAVKDALVKLST